MLKTKRNKNCENFAKVKITLYECSRTTQKECTFSQLVQAELPRGWKNRCRTWLYDIVGNDSNWSYHQGTWNTENMPSYNLNHNMLDAINLNASTKLWHNAFPISLSTANVKYPQRDSLWAISIRPWNKRLLESFAIPV